VPLPSIQEGADPLRGCPTGALRRNEGRREELEASRNPFAAVVLAHLDAPRAKSPEQRFDVRFRLMRKLYASGMERENIGRLYRFLEWIMKLPQPMELEFREKVETEIEGKTAMPYLATFERLAMEKGRGEGLGEALRLVIRSRFGDAGLALLPAVEAVEDADRLRALIEALGRVERIEDLRALLESP